MLSQPSMKKHSIITIVGITALLLSSVATWAGNTSITKSGIGKVKLGETISNLPERIEGLYDKIEFESEEGYEEGENSFEVYHVSLGDNIIFDIFPEEDKVAAITVLSAELKTKKGLGMDSTPAELLAAGGRIISFNDGTVAIVCDGVLFLDIPLSDQGYKKAEQAYLGYDETFDVSDFDTSGHAKRILISGKYGDQGEKTTNSDFKDILILVLFLVATFAMIGHMIYVNFFAKPFPEDTIPVKGMDLNNLFVSSQMDYLYDNVFTPYQDPDDLSGEEPLKFPVGRKAAREANRTLKEIYDNHMPVDGDAADKLRKVSIITNEANKRSFSGSIKFLIITIVIGAGACFLNKEATPLLYFLPACILYYFSCMTPYYIQMEKAIKEMASGKKSSRWTDAIIGGIFSIAASAPMIVEITKDADTGEVLDKSNDSSLQIIGLIVTFLLFILLAYAMLFVGILNYIRNYILR